MKFISGLLVFFVCLARPSAQIYVIPTDNQIKVAVIDTGIKYSYISQTPLCESGHKDFTGEGLADIHGHGTNVVGLIVKNAKVSKYCIILIKAYGFKNGKTTQFISQALHYADIIGADIVNISGGGAGFIKDEYKSVKSLLDRGAVIVAAAGNDKLNLDENCDYYPACYDKRILVVGSFDSYSNYGKIVDIKLDGRNKTAFGVMLSGTSQSTAQFTGLILNLALSKKKK